MPLLKYLKQHSVFILILVASLPLKFAVAQNMPWEIDIVPVVARNVEYTIPPVGTLASVAAYNLPMLSWLHLPAQWITGDVWWTIFLTMLIFNLLSTTAVYALGNRMFNQRVASVAAALFTFSEVGVSSSYTAWAQLLLPGFFAMVMLCLWLWIEREQGVWLALAGIIATAAFMTHFSALLLYPTMLIIALITRTKWQIKWLFMGAGVVALMFTPYILVQIERDFVDAKAFITQEPLVSVDVLAQYEIYKPGYREFESPAQITTIPVIAPIEEIAIEENPTIGATRPRWLRAIDYALEAPSWYWQAMNTAFTTQAPAINQAHPSINPIIQLFFLLQPTLLVISIGAAIIQIIRGDFPKKWTFTTSESGRLLLLVLFISVMIALMILTRTIGNASYWMGFMSIEFLIISYAVILLPNTRRYTLLIILIVCMYIGIQTTERSLRLIQHDDTQFSVYNVSIYRHVEAAIDYIAEDWQGDEAITISYDILQDANNLWWVPAWHTIDPLYTMGMNFDFLLSYHHDFVNTNIDPIGTLDPALADYIVVYTPSLSKYDLEQYTATQFGTIVVLKPMD